MTQKTFEVFIGEIYLKPPEKIYITNRTDVYHTDDTRSWDILDIKDYGPENNWAFRFFLVVIDNFSQNGWTETLKNKNAQTTKVSLEKVPTSTKRSPNLIESVHGGEYHSRIFRNLLDNINIEHYSRNSSLGAIFAERFNRTMKDLLQRPHFERRDGNRSDILPTISKQYNDRIHSSTNLPPGQVRFKKNEGFVHHNSWENRKKLKPMLKIHNLFRTKVLKTTFSERDTTN